MPDLGLSTALVQTLAAELARVTDKILRVEASPDWPVYAAIEILNGTRPVRSLVRRPFTVQKFSRVHATEDAGEATLWRNDRERDFAVIVLGAQTGALDAGLGDIRRVSRRTVVDRWRDNVVRSLEEHGELGKIEVTRLMSALFAQVADGAISAVSLESYLVGIQEEGTASGVCKRLNMVGLVPDSRAIDQGKAAQRAGRNREFVDALKASDDSKIDRLLAKARRSPDGQIAANANLAISFRMSGDFSSLMGMDLPVIEEILKPTGGKAVPRQLSLEDLLDKHTDSPDAVRKCLAVLSSEWNLKIPIGSIDAPFAEGDDAVERVRIRLKPTTRLERVGDDGAETLTLWAPWSGGGDDPILAAQTTRDESGSLEDTSPAKVFRRSDLTQAGSLTSQEVDRYISKRSVLSLYEPWLNPECAVPLLLLNNGARNAVREFIDAWLDLATAAAALHDSPGLTEAVQSLELVQGVDEFGALASVSLGTLHPFRLEPLLRAVEQTSQHLADQNREIAMLGDALQWTIDRSFPAYPTLFVRDETLALASSSRIVTYAKHSSGHLPDARDHKGLDRVFRAIEGFAPWMTRGSSVLLIDPPRGGAVVKALAMARDRRGDQGLHVIHLASHGDADSLDGLDSPVRFLPRVHQLGDVPEMPPVNVIVRFVSERPGGSQSATAAWHATRGSHLALEITERYDGPFGVGNVPTIKLDPRNGNRVVIAVQALYARLKGGMPAMATIRPLLQTDEASVLSGFAKSSDWIVFAAPGPLGLVTPSTINTHLKFVGRANMGPYGLYVYACDNLFPVRKHIESYFRQTPVASVPPEKLVDLLVSKAHRTGQAVLFAGSNGSVAPHIASMVALDVAIEDAAVGDQVFVLSLDDLGWTRYWLASGFRADFLVAYVGAAGEVTFRVVESKSQDQGDKAPLSASNPVIREGLDQVRSTLGALQDIVAPEAPTLDQDLRFSSLIEQLMAAVLARSVELDAQERTRVYDAVNRVSRRDLVPRFDGLVVLTQSGVNAPRERQDAGGGVSIMWVGAPDVARAFGIDSAASNSSEPTGGYQTAEGALTNTEHHIASPNLQGSAQEASRGAALNGCDLEEGEIGELAGGFIAAARLHGVLIDDDRPAYIQVGPTLFSVGVRLREGATLQPLRSRLADIARDIGLGDQSDSIEVENAPEARVIRVLLPRPDRRFPDVPGQARTAVTEGGYLPVFIGKTIDGRDFSTPVEAWPHMLVAGTTGSGKTTFLRTILHQLGQYGSSFLKTVVVDGKGETDYFGLVPSSMFVSEFPDVQLGAEAALRALQWCVEEMELRREHIVDVARRSPSPQGIKGVDIYKRAVRANEVPEITPLLVVIDEFADIMLANRKSAEEFERLVQRISQVGRSRLIHLVMATQRPDKETIRGAIKANLNARAIFRLPTTADSMTVLGHSGAERLLFHGDMLFQDGTSSERRLQGYRF